MQCPSEVPAPAVDIKEYGAAIGRAGPGQKVVGCTAEVTGSSQSSFGQPCEISPHLPALPRTGLAKYI